MGKFIVKVYAKNFGCEGSDNEAGSDERKMRRYDICQREKAKLKRVIIEARIERKKAQQFYGNPEFSVCCKRWRR